MGITLIGDILQVPTADGTENLAMRDVVGNRNDNHVGVNTVAGRIHSAEDHIHHVSLIQPNLADGILVTANVAVWTLGAFAEIAAANAITEDFDIHFISAELSAADEYQLELYCETTVIAKVHITRPAGALTVTQLPIATPICLANSQIQAKLASKGGGVRTAVVTIGYHTY